MIRFAAAFALAASLGAGSASAEDNNGQGGDAPTEVSGVLLSFQPSSIEVLIDGDAAKTHLTMFANIGSDSLVPGKSVFPDNRVTVTVDRIHGPPTCMNIAKAATVPQGSVTGQVVYNDGWSVVVKPKGGIADGYAPTSPVPPEMGAQLKSVHVGDTVTVAFTSDAERHRIKTLTVIAKASDAKANGGKPDSAR